MRLIDADALVRIVQQSTQDAGLHFSDSQKFLRWLRKAPTIDAVPVVYCKDCIHARPLNLREFMIFDSNCFVCTLQHGAGTSFPEYEINGRVVFPKSFCSYAHRRTNGR